MQGKKFNSELAIDFRTTHENHRLSWCFGRKNCHACWFITIILTNCQYHAKAPQQLPGPSRISPGSHQKIFASAQDRPATNTGVQYSLPDIVAMRKCDLVRVLESMGQAVSKRQPTRLELLGAVVSLLCNRQGVCRLNVH